MKSTISSIFPVPIYQVRRDSNLDLTEEAEIADIIKEGKTKNEEVLSLNSVSENSYIFNTKLKKLKQFCEQHIKIYIEQVIIPKKELDFYITQSWLNITKPGGNQLQQYHPNSIISGIFYIAGVDGGTNTGSSGGASGYYYNPNRSGNDGSEETDRIIFQDPNVKMRQAILIDPIEYSVWNSNSWYFSVNNNTLVLFPSWLEHSVDPNGNATTDRISLSFNTFVKGTIGGRNDKTELIL